MSLWLPLRQRSTANGLVKAEALVGIVLTYPVFGWLMERVGWSAAFAVCGVTLMLFSLLWSVIATDDPTGNRRANAAEHEVVAGGEIVLPRTRDTFRGFSRLLRNRSLVLLTLSDGALISVQYTFFYWIEYYLKN